MLGLAAVAQSAALWACLPFPGKTHFVVFHFKYAAVGYGNAEHIPRKVFLHLFRVSYGFLHIHCRVYLMQVRKQSVKLHRHFYPCQLSVKNKLLLFLCLLKLIQKLALMLIVHRKT